MVQYRRNYLPGGCYFFTVTLRNRRSDMLVRHVALLREAFRRVRKQRPFTLDAIVILPEHLHAVLTLPPGDADYSGRWRAIKSQFTRALRTEGIPLQRNRRHEYDLWQRRFWEHIDYCYWNPVKHGWVKRVADWPYSSFHRDVRDGLLPINWGGYEPSSDIDYGE